MIVLVCNMQGGPTGRMGEEGGVIWLNVAVGSPGSQVLLVSR